MGRIALAAALLVLTGCTDDAPKPKAVDSATPSPTPTESASPSPTSAPTLPPEAQGTSNKAAKAFVEYAVDVLNYSGQTLDTQPLKKLQTPNCAACSSIVSTLERIKRAGGSVKGGEWDPIEMIVLQSAEPGVQVQVLLRYDTQVVRTKQGGKPQVFKPGKALYRFSIVSRTSGLELSDLVEVT